MVLSGDGVRSQKINDLVGRKPSITHTSEDLVSAVEGLWDGQVGGWAGDVGAAGLELEARPTDAVGDTNGAGKLDAIIETKFERRCNEYKSLRTSLRRIRRA